ncbi:hypothetical protein HYALB_00002978 [Hymenoscyphus albidus]|uniref:Pet127-domain-containing protein n=1 Tax=Hymenoscyphus albidus TaxID=595503 RepID=A0A9N9M4H5_9HELO|nr:hypothetical protein HYALB_00002978 [Hymenoscyphus albidus]
MISSLFRGRNRTHTAYIRSQCFSRSRLPLPLPPHSPPHTFKTGGNRTSQVQAASFSTSRATRNDEETSKSVQETSHNGLEISAGQNEQTGSDAESGGSERKRPQTEGEPRKLGGPESLLNVERLRTIFAEAAGLSTASTATKSKASGEVPTTATPQGVSATPPNPVDSLVLPSSTSEMSSFSQSSWQLRIIQLKDTFLKGSERPATETIIKAEKTPDTTAISPEWMRHIENLKSSFLTSTSESANSHPISEAAATATSDATKVDSSETKLARKELLPVPPSGISKRTPRSSRETLRAQVLLSQEQSKLKTMKSQEENSSDIDLQNALQLAFETSFESNVLAAAPSVSGSELKGPSIEDTMRPSDRRKRRRMKAPRASKHASSISSKSSKSFRYSKTSKYSQSSKAEEDGISVRQIKIAKGMVGSVETMTSKGLDLVPINVPQPSVPSLSYGLDRVLFNPGVYQLQDPRSRVFNFDPYLQTIMPVKEFDFSLLKKFTTSSKDETLLQITKREGKKYTGSTSSMTAALSQFHYLLSNWRPINAGILSKSFPDPFDTFTAFQRCPAAFYLRWRDGVYAIDADKEFDTSNVLSMLGQSMEKLLTLPNKEFERYRKSSSDPISEETRKESEAYHYTTMGDFLLRSQLDAYDPRIPGTGMFDLKTRAVISIRMDTSGYEEGSGYEIRSRHGEWESFEREYYDMIRSAFLKYSLQVRIGRMDGIFVAFHNTERIFGFQYISLPEMDAALHGTEDTTLGDSEFKLSLNLFNRALDQATARFPNQSLRLLIETRPRSSESTNPFMYIFAEPMDENKIEEIQSTNKAKVLAFEKEVLGLGEETGDDTSSGEAIDKNESGDLDEAENAQNSSSLAWDLDTEGPEMTAGSAQPVDTGESKEDLGQPENNKHPASGDESPPTIMAFRLTVRSEVNGQSVPRPKPLKSMDEWTLEYSLAEIKDPQRVRTLYDASKKRRNIVHNRDKYADDNKFNDSFRDEIKRYTMRGKEYRERLNAEESRGSPRVYG